VRKAAVMANETERTTSNEARLQFDDMLWDAAANVLRIRSGFLAGCDVYLAVPSEREQAAGVLAHLVIQSVPGRERMFRGAFLRPRPAPEADVKGDTDE
jgi:hypothetical protein